MVLGGCLRKSGVLEALKHNKRTLQAERGAGANIDVTKTPLLPLIAPSLIK